MCTLPQQKCRSLTLFSFRWTVLQIKELSGVAGIPTQLRRMLHDMPKTLTDTYDLAIRMTPERQRDDLYRMLEWLIFSRGLLDKLEYSELLAFEWCPFSGLPKFDVELRPSFLSSHLHSF